MPRHHNRAKHIPWTIAEIEKLRKCQRKHYAFEVIRDMFPYRTEISVRSAMYRYRDVIDSDMSIDRVYTRFKKRRYNPNPPTMLTYILVHNYYEDDKKRGMTKAEAIKDIAETLNRSQSWVKQALKPDVRKYAEKDEDKKKDYEEMELRHTYIR